MNKYAGKVRIGVIAILGAFACTLAIFAAARTLTAATSIAPSVRALITQQIDENDLVTLAGNTRPEATAANDRGPVADSFPMEHLWLQLRRSPEQRTGASIVTSISSSDRHSPNYHHWLTAKQFGERYGLAQKDLAAITRWLESHGFTVNLVYPNGTVIDFSGTAGQVREAFHTEIHNLEVNGEAAHRQHERPADSGRACAGGGWRRVAEQLHAASDAPDRAATIRLVTATYLGRTRGPGHHLQSESAVCGGLFGPGADDRGGRGQRRRTAPASWTHVPYRSFGLSAYPDGSFTQVHPSPAAARPSITATAAVATVAIRASSTATRAKRSVDAEWSSAAGA